MVVQEENDTILTEISSLNKQAIILIDFTDALLGIEQNAREQWVLTYSLSLMIDKLSANMSVEEAIEFIDFNILQFFVGEDGPLFRSCLEYSDILSPYEQLLSNKNHLLSCICNKICL